MPLLREICPSPGIRAGIWHITETPDELFSGLTPGKAEVALYHTFRNEQRKRHWLGARAALSALLSPLPSALETDANGKPFLPSRTHHVSLSHAGDYAVAVIRHDGLVGIDIEKISPRIDRVKDRFLLPDELNALEQENRLEQLSLYWGAKEALYKLRGNPGVDLRNDLYVGRFDYLCKSVQTGHARLREDGCWRDYTIWWEEWNGYMIVIAW